MNICIDVGNSTIGIGAFKENKLVERMVVNTDPNFNFLKDLLIILKKVKDTLITSSFLVLSLK